ncbi:MAG: YqeG family HAD IIIA-type phosphatase [Thermoguttaceae bacterium]|nr:YqeG family HAD IIIA-type phosphatase [Thermoguttaceae bacterium]
MNVVNELTPAVLRAINVQHILLDVDCTLKRYDTDLLEDWVLEWLETLEVAGVDVCLLSNGKKSRIGKIAERYDLEYEAMAMKPLPCGCWRVMKRSGWDRETTAIVGDQLMADVAAGNFAGITTIHVTPIHPETEPIFTRIKRPLERLVFRFAMVHRGTFEVQKKETVE